MRSIAETARKKLINKTEYDYKEKTYYAPYKLSKKHKKSYPYKSVAKEATATNILDFLLD
jgi:O-acetyl-ADP-ribose deacetylase (regulator of RNase III)